MSSLVVEETEVARSHPAVRAQEKLDFVVLSLTFSIPGLAVQTAKFGNNAVSDLAELVGWSYLATSGLIGFQRLKWRPIALGLLRSEREFSKKRKPAAEEFAKTDEHLAQVKFWLDSGIRVDSDEEENEARAKVAKIEAKLQATI